MGLGSKLKSLFGKKIDEEFFDDLTDVLVESDIGAKTSYEIVAELEKICKKENITTEDKITEELQKLLLQNVKQTKLEIVPDKVNVWMVLGVNGVGKTTSVAKLANMFRKNGLENLVLASSDTFRAAAIEQLEYHGNNVGVRVVSHQHGSDPSAVVFDACDAVRAKGPGLVLADTAGRLHNKENLVKELQKIDRICQNKADEGCYKRIIVLDCTTGQNALRQAEVFNEAVKVDAIILTKYDSTAKGGVAVSIGRELGLPVAYVCFGEKYDDIKDFDAETYVKELVSNE